MTESEHQILVMCWAKKVALACPGGRAELDLLFHIPNGGGRSKREGMILKAMGVKPGVSDLFLPAPVTGKGSGLWVEMKVPGGSIGSDQWKWISAMRKNGYRAVVAFGWEEAVAVIKDYLGGEWPEVDMSEMVGRLGGRVDG